MRAIKTLPRSRTLSDDGNVPRLRRNDYALKMHSSHPTAKGGLRPFPIPGLESILKTFPEVIAFEVLGHWTDLTTQELKYAVRVFCANFEGRQVGQDLSTRVLGSLDFLLFTSLRQLRTKIALERQQVLTHDDQKQLDLLLLARTVDTWLKFEPAIAERNDCPPAATTVAPKAALSLLQRFRVRFFAVYGGRG
jgi:hypothetical protein